MDIRGSFDGLKSILGVNSTSTAATTATTQSSSVTSTSGSTWSSDQATLSSAGSAVSLSSSDSDVRMDKVAAIQSALAAGTYQASASAVASRLVDSMLTAQ
jgi:negative regulator of flagellin synthesis FlgM